MVSYHQVGLGLQRDYTGIVILAQSNELFMKCRVHLSWIGRRAAVVVGAGVLLTGSLLRGQEDAPLGQPLSPSAKRAALEFFEQQIRPLLARHCYECHSSETGPDNGELILDSASSIRTGGSRGPLLQPHEPRASLLIRAVCYEDEDLQMPPSGKLEARQIEALEHWIEFGAVVPDDEPTSSPRRQPPVDLSVGREYWAFQPLSSAPAPRMAGCRRPLDAFIRQRLTEHGLEPSGEADRRTLVRRVTFDLIGLPPSPEEVAAFLTDDRPDAYERLINRLLASPHYGERWGRFWLDLARYTDTTAKWLTSTGQAWLYRDWAIAAFNRNVPYDEFVRLQLAADLLPNTPPEDLAALGFLGLGPTYWKELRLAPAVIEQIVADEWDERVDAVSRTFLGLTVSCARCHDHKFDPITMQDYYALAGVFASTQLDDCPLLPPADAARVRQAREEIESLDAELQKIEDKAAPEADALQQRIDDIKHRTPHFDEPWAHIVKEASVYVVPDGEDLTKLEYHDDEPRDLPVFRRGNPSNPGETVPRRFLSVLCSEEPPPFHEGSGRRELADALFREGQALTARVIVNRIWSQHFGTGLVRTLSNFGAQGERPSHPELLDHLAAEFVRHDWDLKWLHREIMLSGTYRQTSAANAQAAAVDPENRLLWRMNVRRLDVEMWRDAMLIVAGILDGAIGGPAMPLENERNARRTVYALIARRELNRVLRLYDFPEPTSHSPARAQTTTPLQQLYVFNAPFIERQARAAASRLPGDANDADRITACYQRLFSRDPTAGEMEIGLCFLGPTPSSDIWAAYVHSLLGLNEFLFVD